MAQLASPTGQRPSRPAHPAPTPLSTPPPLPPVPTDTLPPRNIPPLPRLDRDREEETADAAARIARRRLALAGLPPPPPHRSASPVAGRLRPPPRAPLPSPLQPLVSATPISLSDPAPESSSTGLARPHAPAAPPDPCPVAFPAAWCPRPPRRAPRPLLRLAKPSMFLLRCPVPVGFARARHHCASSSATGAPQVLLHVTASTLERLRLRGLAKYHDDRVPLLPLRVSRTSTSSTPHRNAEFLAVTPNIYGNLCDYERERLPSTLSYSDSSSTSTKTNWCHYFHYRRPITV